LSPITTSLSVRATAILLYGSPNKSDRRLVSSVVVGSASVLPENRGYFFGIACGSRTPSTSLGVRPVRRDSELIAVFGDWIKTSTSFPARNENISDIRSGYWFLTVTLPNTLWGCS